MNLGNLSDKTPKMRNAQTVTGTQSPEIQMGEMKQEKKNQKSERKNINFLIVDGIVNLEPETNPSCLALGP